MRRHAPPRPGGLGRPRLRSRWPRCRWLGLAAAWFAVLVLASRSAATADDFTWNPPAGQRAWSNFAHWDGTAFEWPNDNTDTALISGATADDPILDANYFIGALTLQANGDAATGDGTSNFRLVVQDSGGQSGLTLLTGSGSNLTVYRRAVGLNDFDTDDLTINSGADLQLRDGGRAQVDDFLDVNTGGEIEGAGELDINGTADPDNDGLVRASGGVLRIFGTGATFDLDGPGENGQIQASVSSTLLFDMDVGTIFDGIATIGAGATLQINDNWQLSNTAGTELHFNGSSSTATLAGTSFVLAGVAQVNSGVAVLATTTTISNSATLILGAGTTLRLEGPTTVSDPASIFHNGQDTTLVIDAPVAVGGGSGSFDWDGIDAGGATAATTIVGPAGTLTLDVGQLDAPLDPQSFDGTLILNSGDVDVQSAAGEWTMAGTLQLNNTAGDVPVLSGDDLEILGGVEADGTGTSHLAVNVRIGDGGSLRAAAGAKLWIGQ